MQDYSDYLAVEKKQKSEQQRIYRGILDTQMRLKDEMCSRYGTMTDQERRLNKRDLTVPKPCLIQ